VTDYLLKPVSGQKLLETLRQVSNVIEKEQKRQDYRKIYENEHQERLKLERSKFLRQILDGRISMAEAYEKGDMLQINLAYPWYEVVLVQFMPENVSLTQEMSSSDADNREVSELEERIEDNEGAEDNAEVYEQVGRVLCVLLKAQSPEELHAMAEQKIAQIRQIVKPHAGISTYFAVGEPVDRLSEIHHSYHSALRLFAKRFVSPKQHLFAYEQKEEKTEEQPSDSVDISAFDITMLDRENIFRFLRNGLEGDIGDFLKEVLESREENTLKSSLLREYILMDIYVATVSYLKMIGYTSEEINEKCGKLEGTEKSKSVEEMEKFLSDLLHHALEMRDARSESRYSSLIREAQSYIEKNYMKNEISLSSVADEVGVSPNHFSRVFSQETGKTFVEFLTETRMEHARYLLKTTNMNSSDIGVTIGYSDPHYFYYIFKKTQGVTPKEYRNGEKEKKEKS
jgi:two-component system response regulator YesN